MAQCMGSKGKNIDRHQKRLWRYLALPAVALCLLAICSCAFKKGAGNDGGGENLLVRAHSGDFSAMSLAFAHYLNGTGGFPKAGNIAQGWQEYVDGLGLSSESAFMHLMGVADSVNLDKYSPIWLPECEMAKNSVLVESFAANGWFDLEKFCARIAEHKKDTAEWRATYNNYLKLWKEWEHNGAAALSTMRSLTKRPATDKDIQNLGRVKTQEDAYILLFFAATTHDLRQGKPDWDIRRLINFVDQNDSSTNPAIKSLIYYAKRHVAQYGKPEETSSTVKLIRKAHSGDISATIAMAENYRTGESGFPLSNRLYDMWLGRAAMLILNKPDGKTKDSDGI